jgi:hypothetical protein
MLYLALVCSFVMLFGVNYAFLRCKEPVRVSLIWMVAPGALGLLLFSQPVLEFGVAVLMLLLTTNSISQRKVFVPLSLLAFAIVFGVNSWIAWRSCTELRDQHRFESLEARLPNRTLEAVNSSPKTSESFGNLESHVENVLAQNSVRPAALRRLHERAVFVFVSQPNFGVFRGMSVAEWGLKLGVRGDQAVSQPGGRSLSSEQNESVGKIGKADQELAKMHETGALDFIYPNGFGYFKDRQHVVGFQSHQFSQLPDSGKRWKLQSLDLVGLVVHEKPVAYISENLPRMDELRKVPLRDLNAFESAGLTALRKGDELFVREMPDSSVRMLGALRAMKQCINCHGGARGDLLGAFSYELRKE